DYDQLVEESGDPKNVNRLAELGEAISALAPSALIAKEILTLDQQIADSQKLVSDPEFGKLAQEDLIRLNELRAVKLTALTALETNEDS
ncbi:TPA: hypothetical protein DEB02_01530, partial [Candidatus Beckwithbacteria bacterium]|nr:hypothetical protein [Candidatus Beckwithbacteria bacterium]